MTVVRAGLIPSLNPPTCPCYRDSTGVGMSLTGPAMVSPIGGHAMHPGGYPERTDGETLGGIHLDELGTNYETVETTGTPRALGVGQTFRVTDLPRLDQNREYLVVRAHYELRNPDIDSSGTTEAAEVFQGAFRLMDSTSPFRPARHTPRPIVQGPQTAIVVGDKKTQPDSSEIVTDEHARVRVRFFWERLGGERSDEPDDEEKRNEDMTTWVRVSQVWAGSQWGAIHIPRIGQEVIVDFLEGDPDRPSSPAASTTATTCRRTRCRRTRRRAASRAAAPWAADQATSTRSASRTRRAAKSCTCRRSATTRRWSSATSR